MGWQYPGQGLTLYLASSNPQEPVANGMRHYEEEIPDNSYSIGCPVNANFKTMLTVAYDDYPTDITTIEYSDSPTWASPIILDTMPASATDTTNVWTTNDSLPGFIRINNTSGVAILSVKINGQVASVG